MNPQIELRALELSNSAALATAAESKVARRVEYRAIRHRTICSLVLFVATCSAGQLAFGYKIEFSPTLTGGSFLRTQTSGEAVYNVWKFPTKSFFKVPDTSDVSASPTTLKGLDHPLGGTSGKVGRLNVLRTKFQTIAAHVADGSTEIKSLGSGDYQFNVGGTFKVVPEPNELPSGNISLVAQGLINGGVQVDLKTFAGAPSANFSAAVFIEKLGTAKATAGTAGTQSQTVGASGEISKEPNVTGKIDGSTQVTSAGTGPQNFYFQGLAPINQDLNWNFSLSLSAMNTENPVGGRSLAQSWLASQFVNLTPQKRRATKKTPKPKVAYFSNSLFEYNATMGTLGVLHPNAAITPLAGVSLIEDDGTPAPPTAALSFAGFVPEIEVIRIDDQIDEASTDALAGALLNYSGIFLDQENEDGTISFTDGRIDFVDPFDTGSLLGSAQLTDILADFGAEEFSARLSDFSYETLPEGLSELADGFATYGGSIMFDPQIILDSDFFSVSATSSPYSVQASVNVPDADFDNDEDADGSDFLRWQRGVGIAEHATFFDGDTNYDQAVDGLDLANWKTDYGYRAGSAAIATVPEPEALFLLGISLIGVIVVRVPPISV